MEGFGFVSVSVHCTIPLVTRRLWDDYSTLIITLTSDKFLASCPRHHLS
jgi:hypothetical protein